MSYRDGKTWRNVESTTEHGKRLDAKLKEMNLSYAEFSRVADISQQTVFAFRNGKRKNPRQSTIEIISKAINVDPYWLMHGSNDEIYEETKNEQIPLEEVIKDIHDNVYREGIEQGADRLFKFLTEHFEKSGAISLTHNNLEYALKQVKRGNE